MIEKKIYIEVEIHEGVEDFDGVYKTKITHPLLLDQMFLIHTEGTRDLLLSQIEVKEKNQLNDLADVLGKLKDSLKRKGR